MAISDTRELYHWLTGNPDPFSNRYEGILSVEDYSDFETLVGDNEDYSVRKGLSQGIYHYVLSRQPYDFKDGSQRLRAWNAYKEDVLKLENHHVIPLKNANSIQESSSDLRSDKDHPLNSPLNRTMISGEANRNLGSLPPERYLEKLNELTTTGHFLPPSEEFCQRSEESDREYYKRLLKARFDKLKADIHDRINSLL
jgi:hypothetical protein